MGAGIFTWVLERIPLNLPLHLGLVFWEKPSFIQIAAWLGIYGVTAFIVIINIIIFGFVKNIFDKTKQGLPILGLVLGIIIFLFLFSFSPPLPNAPKIYVGLVEPDADSKDFSYGWLEPGRLGTLDIKFQRAMLEVKKECPDLVVWPENGNGIKLLRNREQIEKLKKILSECQKTWGFFSTIDGNGFVETNSLFVMDSEGKIRNKYDKKKLTPTEKNEFMNGRGDGIVLAPLGKKAGILICFEAIFSELSRDRVLKGADFLVVSSSDAPFRKGWIENLHAGFSVFRAVENGVSVLRASSTGPSLWIDSYGRIIKPFDPEGRYIDFSFLPLEKHITFYRKYGFILWVVLIVVYFLFFAIICIRDLKKVELKEPFKGWRFFFLTPFLVFTIGCFQWKKDKQSFFSWKNELKEILFVNYQPSSIGRIRNIANLKMWEPGQWAMATALTLYGYEDISRVDNKNKFGLWLGVEEMARARGFRVDYQKNINIDTIKKWPIPSLLLMKVNNELRPVVLLQWKPNGGISIFDPLQEGMFLNLTSSELEKYFNHEGMALYPPEPEIVDDLDLGSLTF